MSTPCLTVDIPVRIVSEANQREHHMVRYRRSKKQKGAVHRSLFGERKPTLPCTVTLTRFGPRMLDTDNLAGGFKACRDAVADWLDVDDGPDAPVQWVYRQESSKGTVTRYWARVEFEEAN